MGDYVMLNQSRLNLYLAKYKTVELSGPQGDLSIAPIGQTVPISGAYNEILAMTNNGLEDKYIYQGQTKAFGAGMNITVLGPNKHDQITMSDGGLNWVTFALQK